MEQRAGTLDRQVALLFKTVVQRIAAQLLDHIVKRTMMDSYFRGW